MRKPEVIEEGILPCPFCGNTKVEIEQHQVSQWDSILFSAVARCNSCSTVGPTTSCKVSIYDSKWDVRGHVKQKAIELWNKRI